MLSTPQEQIAQVGKLMFERRLTDIAGGNISCRVGDHIYITPTGAGQKYLWDLQPNHILKAPVDSDILLQSPIHSKESISHLLVYRTFPMVTGIIHAHPFHLMPFCAAEKPMPALYKATQIYAESFDFIAEKPMYSEEQGEEIVDKLKGKEEKMTNFAAALLMPKHGIFVAACTLYKALDCLERMDTNAHAYMALHGKIMK
ncbi:MAG TPA: class II aldolase/adducin family protein [Anaerolineales bacterium]|nr:class II aldolase/adducin family protein [Anaerolineales bacterium]